MKGLKNNQFKKREKEEKKIVEKKRILMIQRIKIGIT